jgi:hypothetical protein
MKRFQTIQAFIRPIFHGRRPRGNQAHEKPEEGAQLPELLDMPPDAD